ncbi:MAG: protein kinase [Polyangiaceae bacterium]|nr:protein kinase [Polyangiaceae bacterium]
MRRFDVLVLTALQDELDAILGLGGDIAGTWHATRDAEGYVYHTRQVPADRGGMLTIAAAWIGEMGASAAATRAATLVKELDPGCLAMCGICSGKRGEVTLGDIIVASLVYDYDRGKLVARDEGHAAPDHYHDITTYNLERRWAMDAAYFARDVERIRDLVGPRPLAMRVQMRWLLHAIAAFEQDRAASPKDNPERKKHCPDWPRVVAKARSEELVTLERGGLRLTDRGREFVLEDELLHPDGLPEDPPLRVHVGPIATGSVVREDPLIFERLARHVRKTIGVEMEAAAISQVASHLGRPSIIVKAVSDHADHDKDDSFRAFACRASATWLLTFLQRHLEPLDTNFEVKAVGLDARDERPSQTPHFVDAQTQAVAADLEAAIARRNRLRHVNADTKQVDREILALRRQLREGGVLRAGDSLGDGRYLLLEQVGRGGFAHVWRALDRQTSTHVAIKVLRSDLAHERQRRERFFRGARIMAELHHSAVVKVLEQKGEDGGFHYFVMEFVPGSDLRQAVLRGDVLRNAGLFMVLAVGEALAKAHDRGVIHRDVKPANILIHADGSPRLTDFDLVAAADTTGGTRSGALGTFVYAAPECMHQPQNADPRVDVYGLSMTTVFVLYGRELPLDVVRDAKAFIEKLDCHPELKDELVRATSWEPALRHDNAREFCARVNLTLQRPLRDLPVRAEDKLEEDFFSRI